MASHKRINTTAKAKAGFIEPIVTNLRLIQLITEELFLDN